MTIKAKLIANGLVTAVIIVFISLSSFSSMSFIQEKLSYLTEKSTPFQMRTVEIQRELQRSVTDLLKVNAARNLKEYSTFRAEAEKSLGNVQKTQDLLYNMNIATGRLTLSEELGPIARELFTATEARINGDISANAANAKISQRMEESATRLKALESHINTLQANRSTAFAGALENTGRLSARLRGLEKLHGQIKDLLPALANVHDAHDTSAFLIARGKVRTLLAAAAMHEQSNSISSDIKSLPYDINEFIQFQAAVCIQKDDDSKKWATESLKELIENLNRMRLSLSQEIELDSDHLEIEAGRQGYIFKQSYIANTVLLANSELVAAGLMATGKINRLFNLDSPAALELLSSEIRTIFSKIGASEQKVARSLAALNAGNELKLLHAASDSLAAIRTEFYSPTGIVATLKKKMAAAEQANRSKDKLHAIVVQQSATADSHVAAARNEQEKAITEVNGMTRRSISQIGSIVSVMIVIGMLISFWIYRSVMRPLRVVLNAVRSQQALANENAVLAEAVAGGDLSRKVIISEAIMIDREQTEKDEMWMVLKAVVGMSEAQVKLDKAFAGMTASLCNSRDEEARRDRLKSGLYELAKILRAEQRTAELGDKVLSFLAAFLDAGVAVLYLYDDKHKMLKPVSTYAVPSSKRLNAGFRLGEGLPGQAALDRKNIYLNSMPHDYLQISSALGNAEPLHAAIMPILHNDTLIGVLELGSFKRFSDEDYEFITLSLEGIAIAFNINLSRQRINNLLAESHARTELLRARHDKLHRGYEELEEQARMHSERPVSSIGKPV